MLEYYTTTLGIIEIVASLVSIICVFMLAHERIWNYFWGIIGVLLFGYLFMEFKLYSDMLLQWAYFLPIQLYGLWYWLNGNGASATSQAPITSLTPKYQAISLLVVAAITVCLGKFMITFTDAAVPYEDAYIAAMSIVAQFLLSRKVLQNWILWIVMDVFAVYLFWSRGLYVTSGLYVVFFGLASYGFYKWNKSYKSQKLQKYEVFG